MKQMFSIFHSIMLLVVLSACGTDNPTPPSNTVIADDSTDTYVTTIERDGYSIFFKPQIAWVGDVMPFYDAQKDVFQIFYLQDWRPAAGIIHPIWAVETSDFGVYTNNREAIPVGRSYEQDVVIGTGGAIADDAGLYHFFYTGEMADNPLARQAVMHATSSDLVTWHKDRSFGYMAATSGYNNNEFRDPCVFYDSQEKVYHMAISTHWHGSNALAHYTSHNLLNWSPTAEPLVKDAPHFMECSDFFRMGKWWYVTYSSISAPRCVYYRYKEGSLYDPSGWSDPIALDGRCYYAAKTVADAKGNRYLCGWGQTFAGMYDSSDWGGALVVHRLQQVDGGPFLACSVVDGVYNKYADTVVLVDQAVVGAQIQESSIVLEAKDSRSYVQYNRLRSPMRITCTVDRLTDSSIFGFTFGASSDEQKAQHLRFLLEPENNDKADLAHDSDEFGQLNWRSLYDLRHERSYEITICIEHSIAVMYINNRLAFTSRIYGMENNPWQIFCERGKIAVRDLKIATYKE